MLRSSVSVSLCVCVCLCAVSVFVSQCVSVLCVSVSPCVPVSVFVSLICRFLVSRYTRLAFSPVLLRSSLMLYVCLALVFKSRCHAPPVWLPLSVRVSLFASRACAHVLYLLVCSYLRFSLSLCVCYLSVYIFYGQCGATSMSCCFSRLTFTPCIPPSVTRATPWRRS